MSKRTATVIKERPATVILGAQWGDEGKGKLVDVLCQDFDVCVRFNGGANAGHTIVLPSGQKFAFHLLPSGILAPKTTCLLANGVVVHLPTILQELAALDAAGVSWNGRLKLSERAHLVTELHILADAAREIAAGQSAIGTTRKGIGPCYADKALRINLRLGDLREWDRVCVPSLRRQWDAFKQQHVTVRTPDFDAELLRLRHLAERIVPLLVDSVAFLDDALRAGKRVLLEGANGALLDLDFGTYPYVTSSNVTIGGALTGTGLAPRRIGPVIGIVKAYTTRVGEGPFPTELLDATGESLPRRGHEFGTTTGRPRRCGWLDLCVVRYSARLSGYSALNITKLDILSGLPEIRVCVAYRHPDGKRTEAAVPASLSALGALQPEYETLAGWPDDLSACRSFSQLPANARAYIRRIEQLLQLPICWIGVGPARDALIYRNVPKL